MQKARQENQIPETVIPQYKSKFFSICVILFMIVAIGSWCKKFQPTSGNNVTVESVDVIASETAFQSQPEAVSTEPDSVIGTWKCEQGEVTFTENGHMMMGKNGIVIGGGWLQYEVVDASTLYLSGGDMPVGINMKYEIDGDYLGLELNGETIIFSKDN